MDIKSICDKVHTKLCNNGRSLDILELNSQFRGVIFIGEPMLHRKIYQLYQDGREVCLFLRDQQRWIENGTIVDFEGDLVTIRYEIEDEEEISSWEEMVRLDSIGAVTRKLASVPKSSIDILVSEDCPEAEQINDQ